MILGSKLPEGPTVTIEHGFGRRSSSSNICINLDPLTPPLMEGYIYKVTIWWYEEDLAAHVWTVGS
jgi:hypothetical protein